MSTRHRRGATIFTVPRPANFRPVMHPTESNILHILHVTAAFVLMGYTFFALAAPPETRKKAMIWTGPRPW